MKHRLFTKDGCYPISKLKRIRLADGSTRTSEAVTDQHMLDAGYTLVPEYPTQEGDIGDWLPVRWDSETSNWIIGEEQ
jgi:hypothetical protein